MKRRTTSVIWSALALSIPWMTLQTSSAGTLYPIAISGQPAPDGNGVFGGQGATVSGFAEPTLNNRGVVCFSVVLFGVCRRVPIAESSVECRGCDASRPWRAVSPGLLAGDQFSRVCSDDSGAINDAGQVAFPIESDSTRSGFHHRAVFRKDAGRDSFSFSPTRRTPRQARERLVDLDHQCGDRLLGSRAMSRFTPTSAGTNGGMTDDKADLPQQCGGR